MNQYVGLDISLEETKIRRVRCGRQITAAPLQKCCRVVPSIRGYFLPILSSNEGWQLEFKD
jgi:hypothetical protein